MGAHRHPARLWIPLRDRLITRSVVGGNRVPRFTGWVTAAWRAPAVVVLAAALALTTPAVAVSASAGEPGLSSTAADPARADLGADGAQANAGVLEAPSISADGRFVAFASAATNLVPGDTNGYPDVFVRDRVTGVTTRVSVTDTGGQANGASSSPVMSADGRWVAFTSYANNLTLGDLNVFTGGADVFLHDLVTGHTERVSSAMLGLSANGESDFPTISADGRYVGFDSTASNLVANDTNKHGDVFVWDRETKKIVRASEAADGTEADAGSGLASISADGSRIAFISAADNLVDDDSNGDKDAFVKDLHTGGILHQPGGVAGLPVGPAHRGHPSAHRPGRGRHQPRPGDQPGRGAPGVGVAGAESGAVRQQPRRGSVRARPRRPDLPGLRPDRDAPRRLPAAHHDHLRPAHQRCAQRRAIRLRRR